MAQTDRAAFQAFRESAMDEQIADLAARRARQLKQELEAQLRGADWSDPSPYVQRPYKPFVHTPVPSKIHTAGTMNVSLTPQENDMKNTVSRQNPLADAEAIITVQLTCDGKNVSYLLDQIDSLDGVTGVDLNSVYMNETYTEVDLVPEDECDG